MEWLECIRKTIEYVENNILTINGADDLNEVVFMSPFYLQKGFKVMTGYTLGEYIRNRRLYLAALDLVSNDCKIIDTAYKYGYETPESFTKAFSRFHGVSPSQIRNCTTKINVFLPLNLSIQILGGSKMDYKVCKLDSFTVIGFKKAFTMDTSSTKIPEFWDEVGDKYVKSWWPNKEPATELERAVKDNHVGTYGVCLECDDVNSKEFEYIVGGEYNGGKVPEGMVTYTIPAMQWAKFTCTGPIPGAIQAVNNKIFTEWLPGNPDYEIAAGYNIEWYDPNSIPGTPDYHSEIWIPVKAKK